MAYTPENVNVYLRAFVGCLAGLGASGHYLSDASPLDYTPQAQWADAFAQAIDTAWGSSAPTNAELYAIQLVSAAVWIGRSPLEKTESGFYEAYESLALGIVALVQQGNAQIVAEGIDPNAGGGGSPGAGTVINVDGTMPQPIAMVAGDTYVVDTSRGDVTLQLPQLSKGQGCIVQQDAHTDWSVYSITVECADGVTKIAGQPPNNAIFAATFVMGPGTTPASNQPGADVTFYNGGSAGGYLTA